MLSINCQSWLTLLEQQRAIAVIRSDNAELAYQMALAVAAGGMQAIEITWNTQQAAAVISQLRQELPTCTIGTGTLLTLEQLQQAISVGVQFLFTPHVEEKLIHVAVDADIPIVPGALSPTEIITANQAGATAVKVFPIQAVGGASYIKALQGPLGDIALIPTGGVTVENAKDFIRAGACAVGLAGDLFPQALVAARNWNTIAQRATTLMQTLTQLSN